MTWIDVIQVVNCQIIKAHTKLETTTEGLKSQLPVSSAILTKLVSHSFAGCGTLEMRLSLIKRVNVTNLAKRGTKGGTVV